MTTGSTKAQEVAAAGLSDLARGAIVARLGEVASAAANSKLGALRDNYRKSMDALGNAPVGTTPSKRGSLVVKVAAKGEAQVSNPDRLLAIAEAGGIQPLVALLGAVGGGSPVGREKAAGALWHLALDQSNQVAIAKAGGIAPLVALLDDGTAQAHRHAADALARLALNNPDNQAQMSKRLVTLLVSDSPGAQQRAAHALWELAQDNPGSPVVIVNAGAISPLVNLLSSGHMEAKTEAAGALSTLAHNNSHNQLAIAIGLVALLGSGSADAQVHVTQLLLTLASDAENRAAIAKAGAIPRLVVQLKSDRGEHAAGKDGGHEGIALHRSTTGLGGKESHAKKDKQAEEIQLKSQVRDRGLLSISASLTYDGGHFSAGAGGRAHSPLGRLRRQCRRHRLRLRHQAAGGAAWLGVSRGAEARGHGALRYDARRYGEV